MVKILASDYDGTLRHQDKISEKDRDAIKIWRNAGNLFGIVTGRGSDIVETVTEDNLEVDFMIAYNGADIYSHDGKLIKRSLGNGERLYEMLPVFLRKSGDWVEIITPERTYCVTYEDETSAKRNSWVKREVLREVKQFIHIQSLYDSNEETMKVAQQLNDQFGDVVSALVNVDCLNAPAAGVTKATGVREYAKLASVKNEDIYTIGDSYNDLAMIQTFNGFTLENGAEDIKKIARAVYKGVWELVDEFV